MTTKTKQKTTDKTDAALLSLLSNSRMISAAAIGLEDNAVSAMAASNPEKALQCIHTLTTTALEIVQQRMASSAEAHA